MKYRSLNPFPILIGVLVVLLPSSLPAEVVPARPALLWAAENGQVEIAKLLIEGGAEIDASDHFGNTALHLSLRYPELVTLLLDGGAEVNAKNAFGNTPLHLAVEDKRVVEILLAAGAEVNTKNGFDKTPLDYAMRQGTSSYSLAVIETLIRAGAR
jgi:ankyrin repeat protein